MADSDPRKGFPCDVIDGVENNAIICANTCTQLHRCSMQADVLHCIVLHCSWRQIPTRLTEKGYAVKEHNTPVANFKFL